MNWDTIQGNWTQLTGQAKSHWNLLTGDDLRQSAGCPHRLAGRLQERYGIAKDKAEQQLQEWAAGADESWLW